MLGIAILAVICFLTPFVQEDTLLGFNFIIGTGFYGSKEDVVQTCVWLVRLSLVVAIAAVVFSIIAIALKVADCLNKQGKIHKTLLISVALSLVSALLIFSILPINIATRGIVSPEGFYAFEPVITIIVTVFIAIFFVKSKAEIANANAARVFF